MTTTTLLAVLVGVLLAPGDVLGLAQDGVADNVTTWLPKDLDPQLYNVRVQPILQEGNFTAPARLEFTFLARRSTNRVTVNMRELKIDEASVSLEESTPAGDWSPVSVTAHEYDTELETYTTVLASPLTPSHKYRLKMDYVAAVSDSLRGLYRVSYNDKNHNKQWMAMTQLHPTNARAMFPCMDEPQYKARFTLSVARRPEHTSVANMPLVSSHTDGSWVWDNFETSVPMSSYLIALAVFDFGKIESHYNATTVTPSGAVSRDGDVTFRVWARHEALARGEYASRIGPEVLRYFTRIFNISFPLPKQDMVATPKLMFGAMENWGLIFFREGGLLVNEADTGSQHYVASTVAHELAHQWFGNLVTMRWWNDVWLNEGFATYMSQLGVQHVEPQWRSEGVFVLENMQEVMQKDALPSSHPVSREVSRVSDIDHIFDAISYKKGSSVVRMMSEFLGADAFQRGVNAYLRRHSYANAAQDDLWAALTEAQDSLPPGSSVKSIMDSWTLRTGFPLVTLHRDYCRGTANVSQERFAANAVLSELAAASGDGMESCCWGVPLWVRTARANGKEMAQLHWLEGPTLELRGLPGRGHWLLANGARAGYYRVNYDADNWRLLADDLDSLEDLERAGLVDDALALAGAGRLGYDVVLTLLERLPRREPSLAWVAALPWLSKVTHMLHNPQGPAEPNPFAKWARKVAADLMRVGDSVRTSTDPVDHAFVSRVRRWACAVGVPNCLGDSAAPRTRTESAGETRRFNESDLCGEALSTEEWNDVLMKYIGEDEAFLLKVAECVQSPMAVRRMLELPFLEANNEELGVSLLKNLVANPYSFDAAMEFIRNNWAHLQERYGTTLNHEIVNALVSYVKSNNQMMEMRQLILSLEQNSQPHSLDECDHNMWWIQNLSGKLLQSIQKLE